jgi:hypothetical protein
MNFSIMRTKLYTTVGNETINDTIYRVIHTVNCDAPPITESEFFCHLRQDGDSIMARLDGQEYLMYDFGLEVGDMFERQLCFDEGILGYDDSQLPTQEVLTVDSIELNGEVRKRIVFWSEMWIEGIGSDNSFANMEDCGIVDVSDNLECFHRNGEQEYMGFYDECCPTNLSTRFSDFESSHNTLFPNPISQSQTFKLSSLAEHVQLSFYDANGRLLESVKWADGLSPEKIGIKSGFYTVLIQDDNGSFRQKLLVQ